MGVNYSTKIETNGLYSLYDPRNNRSFNPVENLLTTSGAFNYPINGFNSANTQLDISPFGESVLCKHDLTGISGPFMNARVDTTLLPGAYTMSLWLKSTVAFAASFAYVGETTGEIPATVLNITTSWQRFSFTFNLTNSQNNGRVQLFFANQGDNRVISIYGVQIQRGSFLTDYVSTSGTPRLRSTSLVDLVNGNNLTVYGNPEFNTGGYFQFADNQATQYMMNSLYPNPTAEVTYNIWFRSRFTSPAQTPFTYSVSGNNQMLFYINNSTQIAPFPMGVATPINTLDMTNLWINFSWTRKSSDGVNYFYINGSQVGTTTGNAGVNIPTNGYLIIGQESDSPGGGFDANQNLDGDFGYFSIYNRVLSASEVLQNFNGLKARYGL